MRVFVQSMARCALLLVCAVQCCDWVVLLC